MQFLLFVLVSFLLHSCSEKRNEETSTYNEEQTEIQNQLSVFANPKKLCEVLSKNGIGSLKDWQNPFDMGWGSLTDYYQFGSQNDGNGMQNNIAYYLEGTENEVKSITLNLNINNPSDKKNALKFLADLADKTFASINLQIPTDLTKSILSSKEYKGEVSNFLISNILEKSKIETWKVTIVSN